MDFSWVCFTLDDVEDADVTASFPWDGADHSILGLQETAHDVQYCRLTNCFCLTC